MKKVSSAFFSSTFASTVTFKGIHFLACIMLSKRDDTKGYVFVKAKDEKKRQARVSRKKAKREMQRRRKAHDKARVKSFLTSERIKDNAAESNQARQRAIARRMLPPMEIPEEPEPFDEEAQKKFREDARRGMDEARQAQGLPSFAEEKEARMVRVAERAKPQEKDDEDDTPGHVKRNEERQLEVIRLVSDRFEENLQYGATPEDALTDTASMLGDAFVESLKGADTEAFQRQHDQTPMITPAMSVMLKEIAEGNDLDTAPYDANLKDEQIAHHLGLLNQYKIQRPDRVMEALDWESGHRGDEEDIHPIFNVAGALYNQASSQGIFNTDEANAEEARRREKRNMREEDRRRTVKVASRGFDNVPPYVEGESERGDSPHKVAISDAYQQFFDTADYDSNAKEPSFKFPVNNFTHDTLVDYINQQADKFVSAEGFIEESHSKTRQEKIEEMVSNLQTMINEHAGAALNSTSVGARQKLEFGRTNESGSDPIITPTWKKVAKTLGVGLPYKVNAPDALLTGPLSKFPQFGGNAINPYDPKYRERIATAVGEYVDKLLYPEGEIRSTNPFDNIKPVDIRDSIKLLHPAISSNSRLMSTALDKYRDDLTSLGIETGDEKDKAGVLDNKEIQAGARGHDEAGALGTAMSNIDALSGKSQKGALHFGKTTAELKAMGKEQRDQYIANRTKANKKAMNRFLRAGKGFDAEKPMGEERGKQIAALEHEQMMNEVEHYKRLLAANRISRQEFDDRVGSIIAQKGLGDDLDIDLEEGNKMEMPEVPEGHYLYADKEGNRLTAFEREEKLQSFMNVVVGTHHVLLSAKRKMAKEGEDASLLHNEGDLLDLLKPPSKRAFGPQTKEDTKEDTRINAMRASNLDANWLKTRLSQNNELRENIRELGISPLRFLEQVGDALGDGMDYDNLNAGVLKMMNKMGNTQDLDNDSLNRMLFNFINRRHTKDMKDINHHIKAKEQHKSLCEDTLGEGEHTCVNCIGSPERTGNQGENRGGKGYTRSPYLYDLIKVPNLQEVELGEIGTDENPYPEGRGVETNLINIYHELKGRGDIDGDWERTDGEIKSIGDPKIIRNICERLAQKRTPGMTEDLSKKYGVASRWIQAKPKGVAADIENNPLAAEVWKHAYPSISGTEKIQADKDLQSLIKDQKKDLIGAFNLLSKSKLTDPTLYDGEMSSKGKRRMVRDVLKQSGVAQMQGILKKHNKFFNGWFLDRPDDVEQVRMPGHKQKLKFWEGDLNFNKILNNRVVIGELETKIKGVNPETIDEEGQKQLETNKEELANVKAETQHLTKKAQIYCKNKGQERLGRKHQVSFGHELKRYIKSLKEAKELDEELANAQREVKYMPENSHLATLASLYPQLQEILKEHGDKPEEGRLQTSLDALHKEVYENHNGVNLRNRFNYKLDNSGAIKTPRATSYNPLQADKGLRGRMGETLGSRVNYSGNGYHVPLPSSVDEALAIYKDKGIKVTTEMIEDLKEAENHFNKIQDAQDSFLMNMDGMSERDKIKANRGHTDVNRQNYSNPTGSLTRCGACGGNGHLTQDELISYAKAHNDDLQGHSISSKDVRRWITQHARPALYQSFDEYDVANGCDKSAHDHNEYACPDCQHWDNQVGGWVSDGICGSCLGDGMIDSKDEHLIEHIQNHPHKTGKGITPDNLSNLTRRERMKTLLPPSGEAITDPKRLLGDSSKTFDPLSTMSNNILDEMFSERDKISALDLLLGRIEDGELPDIHTKKELEAAKKASKQRIRESSVMQQVKDDDEVGWVSPFAEEEEDMDFHEDSKPAPGQHKIFDSSTLRSAYETEGKEAVENQLRKIMTVAKRYGLKEKFMEDDNGEDTDVSVYDYLNKKARDIYEHEYKDFEDSRHEVHDKFDRMQKIIHNHVNNDRDWRREHKKILSGGTDEFNAIESMPEGTPQEISAKESEMKRYMNRLYKSPQWTTPLLTHSGGRMMTKWELQHQDAFDRDVDAMHNKTPQDVKDFFKSGLSGRGSNRIRNAFTMANGNEWKDIKAQEDEEIVDFLKDFDNLLESNETPMYSSRSGILKPNNEYLELKRLTGKQVPDDHNEKELPDGNILHDSLQKHSKNAENWLRPARKTTDEEGNNIYEVRPKEDAIHMKIPNEVSKVAKREFGEMANMRAMIAFFKLQSNPHQDHMPNGADGQPMQRILNSVGEPMTLEEYLKEGLSRSQESELKNNIDAMIVDKNGNPIKDYEDKTGKGELNNYHIVNRWPHPKSHNQDMSLEKFNFDEYNDSRMNNDTELNLEKHTSKNFADIVLSHIRKNQETREYKHNDKYDMSQADAKKIVENANKYYDMHHFPNLYIENKLHDFADLYGLESLSEVKQLLQREPELTKEFQDDLEMITSIHPTWSPQQTKLQERLDTAKNLLKPSTSSQKPTSYQGVLPHTIFPQGMTFADLMNRQPPRDDFDKQLEDATAKHLGLSDDEKEMVQVRQAQQEAAQQPGQTSFNPNPIQEPYRQDSTNQEGQQTGFVQVIDNNDMLMQRNQ